MFGLCYRWSLIAGRLPGRTDNEIKNYWNTHIRRKLLTRGIDPTTHRALNEAAQDSATTTISFAASANIKEEDQKSSIINGLLGKDSKKPVQERCPDLNLELQISPPCQPQQPSEPLKSGGRGVCFSCSLGLQDAKNCSCGIDTIGSSTTSGTTNVGYDFLGLKSGVLDYRSLEMK